MTDTGPWSGTLDEGGLPRELPRTVEQFSFTGTAREYFGIWIVNVLLTIVTIGVYSAWAKVRRMRYFYGNTFLAGSSFDYHARPVRILIGRIVVLIILGLYNLIANIYPPAAAILFVLFAFVLPFFVMRGLRFKARVTSFRNVRFDFHGGYWGAFKAYVVGSAITWMSLGVLAPIASRWMWTYLFNNTTYGGRPVTSDPALRALYGQWLLPAAMVLGVVVLFGLSLFAVYPALTALFEDARSGTGDADSMLGLLLTILSIALLPIVILFIFAGLIYAAGARNVAYNATLIDGRHRLMSSIGRWRFVWINVSNLVATVATLGLARPWAAVRLAKFLAASTALEVEGSLDGYISRIEEAGPAVAAEYLDVEGFDFGF